ncbi:HK97-gp10 family putative phage morphogenesis protein [Frigidibacter oleivorans]|uniref:HK97-gp10 family putative phage morphogenesis protein n=1 Tax=Frigidibacter oleivorans TaxID=2487129 RepID=UPI000F8D5B4A|nr:HK97-gp10 family putative phage morphogenesis protein [Frigidibacter oleivorans]
MADDGGLSRFQRRMQAIPREVRAAVKPALVSAAEDVADVQRGLAPTDTGALRDSIAVTGPGQTTPAYSQPGGSRVVGENQAAVTVGSSEVRYAHLQEYGTDKMQAQPYFWPGFRLARKKASAKIKRAMSKAIREART